MIDRNTRMILTAALRVAGMSPDQIAAGLAALEGKSHEREDAQPLAVRQARVCEMLDCSRFHVRKLERLGLIKPVQLAGLKRYPISELMKLIGGGYA